MDKAFVSFSTNDIYLQLAEVMIKSIHLFSKYPIILYCVNFDKPDFYHKYDRLICKRIDYDNEHNIYFLKPKIILDSIVNMHIKNGIYIESDDIVTKFIDNLFDECDATNKHPLCPIHPQDPNNEYSIMKYIDVSEKSMPYVHGHITFTYNNKEFIQKWYELCLEINNVGANWDETVLNVLFWKYKISKYINYIYDPYYTFIYDIENIDKWEPYMNIKSLYNSELILSKIYMWHGCKDVEKSNNLLNYLKTFG